MKHLAIILAVVTAYVTIVEGWTLDAETCRTFFPDESHRNAVTNTYYKFDADSCMEIHCNPTKSVGRIEQCNAMTPTARPTMCHMVKAMREDCYYDKVPLPGFCCHTYNKICKTGTFSKYWTQEGFDDCMDTHAFMLDMIPEGEDCSGVARRRNHHGRGNGQGHHGQGHHGQGHHGQRHHGRGYQMSSPW